MLCLKFVLGMTMEFSNKNKVLDLTHHPPCHYFLILCPFSRGAVRNPRSSLGDTGSNLQGQAAPSTRKLQCRDKSGFPSFFLISNGRPFTNSISSLTFCFSIALFYCCSTKSYDETLSIYIINQGNRQKYALIYLPKIPNICLASFKHLVACFISPTQSEAYCKKVQISREFALQNE